VADVDMVGAATIHLAMHHVDQMITRVSENLQVIVRNCILEDEVALATILLAVGIIDQNAGHVKKSNGVGHSNKQYGQPFSWDLPHPGRCGLRYSSGPSTHSFIAGSQDA
jgi:hypothetical protein